MSPDPSGLAGLGAVVLLAAAAIAAWFAGKSTQRKADELEASIAKGKGSEAATKAAKESHADAIDQMDADQLDAHIRTLRERLRRRRGG